MNLNSNSNKILVLDYLKIPPIRGEKQFFSPGYNGTIHVSLGKTFQEIFLPLLNDPIEIGHIEIMKIKIISVLNGLQLRTCLYAERWSIQEVAGRIISMLSYQEINKKEYFSREGKFSYFPFNNNGETWYVYLYWRPKDKEWFIECSPANATTCHAGEFVFH